MAIRYDMGNPQWAMIRRLENQARAKEQSEMMGTLLGEAIGSASTKKLRDSYMKYLDENEGTQITLADYERKIFKPEQQKIKAEKEAQRAEDKRIKAEDKAEDKASAKIARDARRLARKQKRESKLSPYESRLEWQRKRKEARQDKKRSRLRPGTPIAEDADFTAESIDDSGGILDVARDAMRTGTDAFGNPRVLGYSADEASDAITSIPGILGEVYDDWAPWINKNILRRGTPSSVLPSDERLGFIPPVSMKGADSSQEWDYSGETDSGFYGPGVTDELPMQPGYSDKYGTYDESKNVIDYYKGTSPTKNVAEPSGFRPWAPEYDASLSGSVMDTPPNPLNQLDIEGITRLMGDFEGFNEGNNRNASIFTDSMAKLGATKSKKSFVGSDGKTYHYAEFPDADTAFNANKQMVASMLDSTGGDIEQFIMNYIDKPKGDPEVLSRLQEMRRRNLLGQALNNKGAY